MGCKRWLGGDITEFDIEIIALDLFGSLGYTILSGPEVAPDQIAAEHAYYDEVLLRHHISTALVRLNQAIPNDALKDALCKLIRPESPSLLANNRTFHRMLVDGVPMEYRRKDGSTVTRIKPLLNFQPRSYLS